MNQNSLHSQQDRILKAFGNKTPYELQKKLGGSDQIFDFFLVTNLGSESLFFTSFLCVKMAWGASRRAPPLSGAPARGTLLEASPGNSYVHKESVMKMRFSNLERTAGHGSSQAPKSFDIAQNIGVRGLNGTSGVWDPSKIAVLQFTFIKFTSTLTLSFVLQGFIDSKMMLKKKLRNCNFEPSAHVEPFKRSRAFNGSTTQSGEQLEKLKCEKLKCENFKREKLECQNFKYDNFKCEKFNFEKLRCEKYKFEDLKCEKLECEELNCEKTEV